MKRKTRQKIHTFFGIAAAILLAAIFVFSAIAPVKLVANAADGHNDYDGTDILQDLSDIDPLEYPANANGTPEIIRVQEYCFSEKVFYTEFYGLYIYLYNPNCKPLKQTLCSITIATEYAYNSKGELAPIDFESRTLTFLDSAYENRFYKFKIAGSDLLATARGYAALSNGTRRYDFTDIKLRYEDNSTLNTSELDRSFSKTYYFSGYGEGLDDSSENASTLKAEVGVLETIVLKVNHASYRTGDYVDYVCDEMQTAYFAVDEKYFQNYGALQKIKAEWYEYKTKPIFVTSDSSAYAALYDYIGKNYTDSLEWRVLWEEDYSFTGIGTGSNARYDFKKAYNGHTGQFSDDTYTETVSTHVSTYSTYNATDVDRIEWLFDAGDVETVEDYTIDAATVQDYMNWYSQTFSPTSARTEDGKYSVNLFDDSIDSDRTYVLKNPSSKRGYAVQEIDANKVGDKKNLLLEKNQSDWDKFWKGAKYEEKTLDPIIVLTANDLTNLTAETFGKKYYISEDYREECFNYCKTTTANGSRAILFRFAVSDYYASAARFDKDGNGMSDQDGYVAQMTQFLDFRVISLTFRDENKIDTVIGVVSTPIDIINAIEAGDDLTVDNGVDFGNWDWESLIDIGFSSVKNALITIGVILIGGAIAIVLIVWLWRGFWALIRALLRKR